MKKLKINKALAKPLLIQTLKGLFFKVGFVAVVLIALIGTQLGQTREDSVQHIRDSDNRGFLVVGDIKASNPCPVGEVLGVYDKPIYNEEGTLIIDWKKAWMCFPEAFESASS